MSCLFRKRQLRWSNKGNLLLSPTSLLTEKNNRLLEKEILWSTSPCNFWANCAYYRSMQRSKVKTLKWNESVLVSCISLKENKVVGSRLWYVRNTCFFLEIKHYKNNQMSLSLSNSQRGRQRWLEDSVQRKGRDSKRGHEADHAVNTALNEMETLKQNTNSYMK